MSIPVSVCGFFAIFSDGNLLLSKLNGMAFLFDTKKEAEAQMWHLRKAWPGTPMVILECNLYLPEGENPEVAK
jgi:hypothetical protein